MRPVLHFLLLVLLGLGLALAPVADAARVRRGLSAEATTALSTTYGTLTLDDDTVGDAGARPLPDQCRLVMIVVELDTIVTAASVVWYLSADLAGDVPLTREVTSTILSQGTTADDGGIATRLEVDHVRLAAGTAGKLYLRAKTDAGTANAKARVTWREDL